VGQLIAQILVKFGRAEGHMAPLGRAQFHASRFLSWECDPKIAQSQRYAAW